jgi:hypothetical protein
LTRHSSSPAGWFLLGDGFGDLNEQAFGRHAPRLTHPVRDYYLLHGPHRSYASFSHNPNYWWPEDAPAVEAYPTGAENPAHSGMDVLNDPGAAIPWMP